MLPRRRHASSRRGANYSGTWRRYSHQSVAADTTAAAGEDKDIRAITAREIFFVDYRLFNICGKWRRIASRHENQ